MRTAKAITVTFTRETKRYLRGSRGKIKKLETFCVGESLTGVSTTNVVFVDGEPIECFDLLLASGDKVLRIPYASVFLLES